MNDSMRPCVAVFGSAHLDILARAKYRDDVIDRQGEVSIEIGGTAFNVANDLVKLGTLVRFVSAMNPSAYSRMIDSYMQEQGIDTRILFDPGLPSGGFSAHIDTKGELASAISCMPVEQVMFTDEHVTQALRGAHAVVADCNLSARMLGRLITLANDLDVPIYLCAVSEEKSLRMSGLSGRIKGIFINEREYDFFRKHQFGESQASVQWAAQHMETTFILTQGAQGTTVVHPDGSVHHIEPADLSGLRGSRLGMGDALAAGTIYHHIRGASVADAVALSMDLVHSIGQSSNCHSGRPDTLESSIDRVIHRAGHDAMTGVLNRHSTERMLGASMERRRMGMSQDLALLILDIDHFKQINDTYGHNVGDEVIIAVSRVAQQCLRTQDSLGRWGGEEFIVILPDTNAEEAKQVAERIRATIEREVRKPRPITISIGCAQWSDAQGVTIRGWVEDADRALYEAKRSGRNRVIHAQQLELAST